MLNKTERLQLVPFRPDHLLALIEGVEQFGQAFGYPPADGLREFFVSGDVSAEWLEMLRSAAGADPWVFGFALVDDQSRQVIGTAGFKGSPNDEGVAEIAYAIVPAFEGRGYATEAAQALLSFAKADPRVRTVIAHTLPEPNASTKVLQKCGFEFVGEVVDPEDGPVWRWQLAERSGSAVS